MIGPCGRLGARCSQHPVAEFDNQPGVLSDRDEVGRRDHASLRMVPAQQRLAAGHLVAIEINHRLVVNLEAAVGERLTHIPFQRKPRFGFGIHRRLKEAIGSAAVSLGAIHREIGVLD